MLACGPCVGTPPELAELSVPAMVLTTVIATVISSIAAQTTKLLLQLLLITISKYY